jgi:hypothetical protein
MGAAEAELCAALPEGGWFVFCAWPRPEPGSESHSLCMFAIKVCPKLYVRRKVCVDVVAYGGWSCQGSMSAEKKAKPELENTTKGLTCSTSHDNQRHQHSSAQANPSADKDKSF